MLPEAPKSPVGPSTGDAIVPIYTRTFLLSDEQSAKELEVNGPQHHLQEYLLRFTGGRKVYYVAMSVSSSRTNALVCICLLAKAHSGTI